MIATNERGDACCGDLNGAKLLAFRGVAASSLSKHFDGCFSGRLDCEPLLGDDAGWFGAGADASDAVRRSAPQPLGRSLRSILTTDCCTVWLGRSVPPYSFACPTSGSEYALLLVVGDSGVSRDEQASLSEQFVRAGCRHAVCFGPTSSTWDDSIDMVWVMDEVDGRAGPFVMTSWFDHDPLPEAVDFFADCTAFDEWVPKHFVAFVLGGAPDLEREVHRALLARFG